MMMTTKASVHTAIVLLALTTLQVSVLAFSPSVRDHSAIAQKQSSWRQSSLLSTPNGSWVGGAYDPTDVVPETQTSSSPKTAATSSNANKASQLKKDLLKLAAETKRGFKATSKERQRARELIFQLGDLNPTAEPARSYYPDSTSSGATSTIPTGPALAGKWTLAYTDAPDITGLDNGPNSVATLGRIGQECKPPTIKNVIEWKRPEWAAKLPFSGTDDSRVLQKVVTSASASPDKPTIVELKLAGFEVSTGSDGEKEDLPQAIQNKGLIAGLLQSRPVNVKLEAPFGKFEILYLDEELRIILTRTYVAVNLRMSRDDEWF